MIKYNSNTINDWNFGDDNIIKVYRNGAVVFYKFDSEQGGYKVCYAVVDDISKYTDREYEDVFETSSGKWYKLNNLNQYEKYGVYGSGRTSCEGSTSRLPQGYTEVEYIRQNSNYDAYINTGVIIFDNTTNTYTITTKLTSEFHSNLGCATIINCERVNSPYDGLGYRYKCSSTVDQLEFFGGNPNYNSSVVDNGDGTRTVTFQSTGNTSYTTNVPLSFFCSFNNSSYTSAYRFADATIYSSTIVKNGITVRDFVPAKRDSDSVYGLYDLITDTFYTSPNGNNFIGGEPVTPTDCVTTYEGKLTIDDGYEYEWNGSSWVNLGEVSGSTIDTVWIDPPSTSNQNASFTVGHYWGEGYKMIMNAYLSGSYSSDVGSLWRWNQHTPIEFNFYANGFYYDFHNPTSTSAPNVATSDYSWRIMKNRTLNSYENGQIFNIILTNGTVRVELEDGTVIVNGSTSVSTQSWYNGLYQVDLGIMNTSNKCHTSRIQVYNANDELVNDIKFVKNQGVTGSQEISMYDSVLDVTYNNTNSNTPTYHIVEESGGTEYPIYYDEIQDPPNNVTFTSMTEAESYECPWVGMIATIDGDRYVFSGDSISGYEWVEYSGRLPYGYVEVEYIQNTGFSYINTDFMPNTNTRVVVDMQLVTTGDFPRLFGAGTWNASTAIHVDYEGGHLQVCWFGKTSWTSTSVATSYDRRTIDLDKNKLYVNGTQIASTTYSSLIQATQKLAIFTHIDNGQPAAHELKRYFQGKLYSAQLYDNGTMIRNYVPCINPNNVVGLYDLVNDVFYTAPSEFTTDTFVAGNPV